MANPPDDAVQAYVTQWWVTDETPTLCRGSLIWAPLGHVDQEPKRLIVEGRSDPTSHDRALYRVEPYQTGAGRPHQKLPVAGMPEGAGEFHLAIVAKRRPALVMAEQAPEVQKALRIGAARWQTARTIIVAPYYGADPGPRGGWKPEFITRIRRAEYPQYVWDSLPTGTNSGTSILRLDHVQPISTLRGTYDCTRYRLAPEALQIIEDSLEWLRIGRLPKGPLQETRDFIASEFSAALPPD